MNVFADEIECVARLSTPAQIGLVADVTGLTVRVTGLPAPVGTMCEIRRGDATVVEAQVVGFGQDEAVLMPLKDTLGIARGDRVTAVSGEARVGVCDELIGRVLDGLGQVIDPGPRVHPSAFYPVYRPAPKALLRPRISEPISTGIRAMDAMLTAGRGQRMGLFAGTGVGKSVLIGMVARHTDADVSVVALVGERGREVNDFIEKDLGPQGRKKAVLVVSTSDESPVLRVRAGFVATAVAEYFRDRGKNVLLLMDSVTRLATAQRQIGLAAGEPPATKGYTPSVFALFPQLLERAGRTDKGSITGFYSVLVGPTTSTTRSATPSAACSTGTCGCRAGSPASRTTRRSASPTASAALWSTWSTRPNCGPPARSGRCWPPGTRSRTWSASGPMRRAQIRNSTP